MDEPIWTQILMDEPIWTQVLESGWDTFEWWTAAEFLEGDWDVPGVVLVTHTPPDDPDEPATTHRLDEAAINAAYVTAKLKHSGGLFHLFEDDIDAIAGDVVMQIACFGKIVYG